MVDSAGVLKRPAGVSDRFLIGSQTRVNFNLHLSNVCPENLEIETLMSHKISSQIYFQLS